MPHAGNSQGRATPAHVPVATYRLQLTPDFGFEAAAAAADYLAALGVSHLYSSPYLQAVAGSTHGYDIVDPSRVSDDLGGATGHRVLVTRLAEHGLGQVVDVVPNHVGLDANANPWWRDLLRLGPNSRYARFFDVDWEQPGPFRGQIVLPLLDQPLDDLIAAGTVRVEAGDEWTVRVGEQRLPVDPSTVPADGSIPTGPAAAGFLDRQHYVLVEWTTGLHALNYRRFFDVSQLGALRVEEPEVFESVHRLPLQWIASGEADGLRIDHPDGLADPIGYAAELRRHAPDAWICVEKILTDDERLGPEWPVDGTTGYEALAELTALLLDPDGEPTLDEVYADVTGTATTFSAEARAGRVQVLDELFEPEMRRAEQALARAAAAVGLQPSEGELTGTLRAFLVELPVYRTYSWPDRPTSSQDRAVVAETVQRVRRHHAGFSPVLLDLLSTVIGDGAEQAGRPELATLARTVQQMTGPVMAKGVEDTAFYRYTRFLALNEVGGDPARFGTDVEDFHRWARRRADELPHAMVTTSTHDTKRSEDVRARLAVLSEIPDDWAAWLRTWDERAGRLWPSTVARDPALEVLIHQTVVGCYPLEPRRLHDYLDKAMREAKRGTSWLRPDEAVEQTTHRFVDHLLADERYARDVEAWWHRLLVPGRINSLAQKLLAMTIPGVPDVYQGTELWCLDLADPDNRRPVDFGLRRAVLEHLGPDAGDGDTWRQSLADPADPGTAKLALVRAALAVRRRQRACFVGAGAVYRPLPTSGAADAHVVAFARGDAVVAVVPRLGVRRERDGGWRATTIDLPAGEWRDCITGASWPAGPTLVEAVLARFPTALLERA